MKNFILFSAMLAATSLSASAQAPQMVAGKANAFDVTKNVLKSVAKPADLKAMQTAAAPNRSLEDGVCYTRPYGVYYSAYAFGPDKTPAWLVPGLAPVVYENMCANPGQATWSYSNGNSVEDWSSFTDVDNNLSYTWGANPNTDPDAFIIAYYAPTLTLGNSSFTAPFYQAIANDVSPMVNHNVKNPDIYGLGFTDGPGFGSNSVLEQDLLGDPNAGITKVHGTLEVFEKPVSPMYVESFDLPFVSYQEDVLNGKELTMKVYGFSENGEIVREAKEVLVCNSVEILGSDQRSSGETFWYGTASFSKLTKNEFGDDVTAPFVIDYSYAVELSGYDQEGVDIQFTVVYVSDAYDACNEAPTRFTCETNDGSFAYYSFGSQSKFYKMQMYINAFYEGVEPLGDYRYLVISDDGGSALTDNPTMSEDKKVDFVPFTSAAPFFAYDENNEVVGQNYEVVGLPDWLEVEDFTDQFREQGGFSAVSFKATGALPAGVDGRQAEIYLVGRGGMRNALPIVVRQGGVSGIGTVIAEDNAAVNYYNVSGQRVNNAKGLVISKAGKQIVK